MEAKTLDRRVRRTRRLLKDGLTELLREMPFSEISARSITDRKDLNRATFYLHYKNTYDLLQDVEEDFFNRAQEMFDQQIGNLEANSIRPLFEAFLDYIIDNRGVCEALLKNDSNSDFTDRAFTFIHDNGDPVLREQFPEAPEDKIEYLLSYTCFGLIGMVKRWFDNDMDLDKNDLLDLADKLVDYNKKILR